MLSEKFSRVQETHKTVPCAIRGPLCYDERMLRRYFAPLGFVIMIFSLLIFIKEALRCVTSITHWLLVFGWLAFVIYCIVSFFSIRVADKLEFSLEYERILNSWPPNNEMELFLFEGFFCTRLTCEFGYGKGIIVKKSFYLFSKSPICQNTIKGQGLFILENLNKSNIIIIPKNDQTEAWMNTALKISDIPTFPAVAFKQGYEPEPVVWD